MIDPRYSEEVLAAWHADQEHPHRGRVKRPLPPVAVVRRLLDECFLATLRDEEGQPIHFSVGLVFDQEVDSLVSPAMHPPLRLDSQAEFSAASLAKLAPAFDPALTTIILNCNSSNETLEYWGLWLHAQGPNRFSDLPVGVEGGANFRPDIFTVISRGRAAFAIARGNSLIGIFQAGYFKEAKPTPFTNDSLGGHVYAAVEKDPVFASLGVDYWLYIRDGLELLLSEASLRGHGGTIVLLPPGLASADSRFASKYKIGGSTNLKETLRKCIESKREIAVSSAYRRVANDSIQRISQLAAVDGALVLTFDFEVIAFGATLIAPRSSAISTIGADGFGRASGQRFDVHRYGTRHRSAMDFVAAVPHAIVFVISQDGPIRAFRSEDGETVEVWPDCTTSMFV